MTPRPTWAVCAAVVFALLRICSVVDAETAAAEKTVLYNLITSNPTTFGQLRNWSTSTDPCEYFFGPNKWAGVGCEPDATDPDIYHITSLHLSDPGHIIANRDPSLSGTFPASAINQLVYLKEIHFSYNDFVGSLPPLDNLVNLLTISMSNNLFTGGIPASWGNLPAIKSIDVASNALTDPLPASLFSSLSLSRLTLNSNSIQGSLPEFGENITLEILNVAFNELVGNIPESIANAKQLQRVNLNGNNLDGPLPAGLDLPSLMNIDLSDNDLEGELPPFSSKYLATINMRGNRIAGSIPSSLSAAKQLHVLNLACNQLTGSIPQFLSSSRALQILRLEVNNMTGEFPTWLSRRPYVGGYDALGQPFTDVLMRFNASCNFFDELQLPQWCSVDSACIADCSGPGERVCSATSDFTVTVPPVPPVTTTTGAPEDDSAGRRLDASSLLSSLSASLFLSNFLLLL